MDIGGPFAFGEPPDDFGLPGFGNEPDSPQRGWLPPEDRLWRHPSELRAGAQARGSTRRRPVNRWVAATVGVVGAAAVASVAVAVTRTPAPASGTFADGSVAATDTSLAVTPTLPASAAKGESVTIGPDVVQIVDAARPSMVALQAASSGAPRATGVVIPGGTLVVTAASAVGNATRFSVVGADGHRQTGQLVGVDARSGVAVIRVSDGLAAASFADEPVSMHQLAVAACICDASIGRSDSPSGAGRAEMAVGMVHAMGTAATLDGGPSLVDAIEAEAPGPSSWGSVLLDDQGQVMGILDGERNVGDDVFGYFVPAPLVIGVANELAKDHKVGRGWLGVVCADAPNGGAEVTTVLGGSPAATAGLHTGDVVEAVDAHPVASLADLQARLYTSEPGTRLLLTVLHGSAVTTTEVVVQASPS
jgi:S1-C subfamily serine protease